MRDAERTKEQLINQLVELRQRVNELEPLEAQRKSAERAIQEACEYAESVVNTVREPLVVLDGDLRVISANRSFYQTFNVTAEETEGHLIYDLGNNQWDIPRLRELLEEIIPENTTIENFEVEHKFETLGHRTMLLNARRIFQKGKGTQMILLAIEDITPLKRAEAQRLREARLQGVLEMAAATCHELSQPIQVISGYSELLLRNMPEDNPIYERIDKMREDVTRVSEIVDKLIWITRYETCDYPGGKRIINIDKASRKA